MSLAEERGSRGVVVITGCGEGIGLRIAVLLARSGYIAVATTRSLRRELIEAGDRSEGMLCPRELDVRDAKRAREVLAEAVELGPLRAVVNNAGVPVNGFFETVDEDALRDGIETNFIGAWRLTQLAVPHLKAAAPATVVQISSRGGRVGLPLLAGYAATKHALEGFSEAARHELAPFGIRVVLIEPGSVKTALHADADTDDALFAGPRGAVIERMVRRNRRHVQRRGLDPDAVAVRVLKAIESPRPRFRQPLGLDARIPLAMKRMLPFRVMEATVGRALKSAGYPPADA
jgi:NAD(P)-dependent dehydrogenase (short-subunit alcohol dehydrogenase family)